MSLLLAGTFILSVCVRQPAPVTSTPISNAVVASPIDAAEASNGFLVKVDLASPFATERYVTALSRSMVLKPPPVRSEEESAVPLTAEWIWTRCNGCIICCVAK